MGAARRKVLAGTAVAGLLSLGLAGPAEASGTSQDGCTVTPLRPAATGAHDSSNRPEVRFTVRIDCEPNRTVHIRQKLYERDANSPQLLDSYLWKYTWKGSTNFRHDRNTTIFLPRTDSDGDEEVYHETYFRVYSLDGVKGTLSPTSASAVRVIYH